MPGISLTAPKIQVPRVVAADPMAGCDFAKLWLFFNAARFVVEGAARMEFAAAGEVQRAGDHAGDSGEARGGVATF